MSTIKLSNEILEVKINTEGAELCQLYSKNTETEYLWHADEKYWKRHAPILFPIVGSLKENTYFVQNKAYQLTQHGFARDMQFEIVQTNQTFARLLLTASEATRKIYPFEFELAVEYQLNDNVVEVTYQVTNPAKNQDLYFSIGAHPAFKLPLDLKTSFEDYQLTISPKIERKQYAVTAEGLKAIGPSQQVQFPLKRALFKDDALVFETKGQNKVTLHSPKSKRAVELSYDQMPYLGLWSPYPADAPFVCIEPWSGIADLFDSNQDFTQKMGINLLKPQEIFTNKYNIKLI